MSARTWFTSLADAPHMIDAWRNDYNTQRPTAHSAIGRRTSSSSSPRTGHPSPRSHRNWTKDGGRWRSRFPGLPLPTKTGLKLGDCFTLWMLFHACQLLGPIRAALIRRGQRHDGSGNRDRKSTRLNSSHGYISYAVFCLKKKNESRCRLIARRDNEKTADRVLNNGVITS